MKRLKIVLLIVLCLSCLTACTKNIPDNTKEASSYPNHANVFVTKAQLYSILSSKGNKEIPIEGKIRAGVVPHHLAAGYIIKDFFDVISREKPGTIILVGPNHHNMGTKIITGLYGWQTWDGVITSNKEIVNTLIEQGMALCDEKTLSQEHAIGNLVPFIKHYLPDASVVPIIFHHDVSINEVNKVLDVLHPLLKEDVMIIASVDFSHYLSRVQAEEKDEQTLKVLESYAYTYLYKMGNEYLDSPASLAFFLRFMEKRNYTKIQVLNNTNSGELLRNESIETTSYFTVVGADITKK